MQSQVFMQITGKLKGIQVKTLFRLGKYLFSKEQ